MNKEELLDEIENMPREDLDKMIKLASQLKESRKTAVEKLIESTLNNKKYNSLSVVIGKSVYEKALFEDYSKDLLNTLSLMLLESFDSEGETFQSDGLEYKSLRNDEFWNIATKLGLDLERPKIDEPKKIELTDIPYCSSKGLIMQSVDLAVGSPTQYSGAAAAVKAKNLFLGKGLE